MPRYQIGDPVEVDVARLEHTPGSGIELLDDPNPTVQWTTGIVEAVRTPPGGAGDERYQIRLTGEVRPGDVAEVTADTLRPPTD